MNFQFTSKQKLFTYILLGLGLVLTVFGVFTEKSHLYTTQVDNNGIDWLTKYANHPDHTFPLVTERDKAKLKDEFEDSKALLVEYYHELPYTLEEFESKIKTLAKENKIDVHFKNLAEHNNHAESNSHAEVTDSHNDGNAEKASKGHASHDFVMLITATKVHSKNDDDHGHATAHSPIETLEHIIHNDAAFADTHHARSWSNLLVNAFYFFGISLGALFFIALQYATESGWGVATKRVLEAITAYLPIGALMLMLVFAASTLGWNHIYHWMDADLHDVNSPHYDAIIANKKPFLTKGAFWIINIIFFAVVILFARGFRKRSLQEDIEGGTKIHFKNFAKGALYLVLFGYLSSVVSWEWIMSIEPHWFSTLFGWYVFSGIWISGIIGILLFVFFLKGRGYMDFVNESHIHDLGKWMFAVSILWGYLFFSQFMLIWYPNIPEEVTYYVVRFNDYKYLLWTMFAINLVLPLVFLMSREAKRSKITIVILGFILIITHWIDVFIMIMPGTVFDHWKIGALEVGMFIFFLGLFIHVILRALTKAPLLVKNHPYLDENLHQHT